MKTLILMSLSVVLLFLGCGTPKVPANEKKNYPSWYRVPPASTQNDLYGVGEGKTPQEALNNALSAVLATLSVSISSEFQAKTVVKEGYNSSSLAVYKNDVTTKVKKLRVSHYELVESVKLGFEHYAALVKVQKQKFFASLQNELEQKISMLKKQEKIFQNEHALKRLRFYKDALARFENIQNMLLVMQVLNPKFKAKPYLEYYTNLQKKYEVTLRSISFALHASRKLKDIKQAVAKGLSQKQFRIARSDDVNHFHIFIQAQTEYAKSYGFYLARSAITLETQTYDGITIGNNTLYITGQSSQSRAIAKQDVVKKLIERINTQGIEKVLNLDLSVN